MNSIADVASSEIASEEFRFFIYDPEGWGFKYYRTPEDRDAARGTIIQAYLDDGWDEGVEGVVAGEVTHICHKTEVEKRPDQVDEDGLDADGNYWAEEWDEKCNYDLIPLGTPAPQAWLDVQAERIRQVKAEGWTPEHDDTVTKTGCLATAAACYLLESDAYPNAGHPPPLWPWAAGWWKPKDYRRDLVRAGALVVAELERLDRASAAAQGGE